MTINNPVIKKIFHSQTNSFTFAAILISISTVCSGVLGLLRDRLLAGRFGAGETLDIYFAAFRIPDILQGILVAGGITAVFLPVFSEEHKKEKQGAFWFANNILNCSLVFLVIVSLVLFLLTPQVLRLVVPGFTPDQRQTTAVLTRILLLSPILFSLSAVFSGVLQYFDRFLAYSLAPILYNLGIILGILFFVPKIGISGLAWGVILGAALHFLIQVPAAKNSGFHYLRIFSLKDAILLKTLKLTVPSAVGSGFAQINLAVVTSLCSVLIPGSIAIFTFSKNLQYFPIGMIGIPFAIAAFPILSKHWALKKKQEFWKSLSLAVRQVLFLTIPISVLMLVLRSQIVRMVLGTGAWGWPETRLTAGCLGVFSFSIFAFSLTPVFQKGFYSIQDTKTPTFLQILTVLINIILSFLFVILLKTSPVFIDFLAGLLKLEDIQNIEVLAFPLALTISGLLHCLLLSWFLVKRTGIFELGEITRSLKMIMISTIIMAVCVWVTLRPLALIFPLNTFWGVFFQAFFAASFGALIYLLEAIIFKSPELGNLVQSLVKK